MIEANRMLSLMSRLAGREIPRSSKLTLDASSPSHTERMKTECPSLPSCLPKSGVLIHSLPSASLRAGTFTNSQVRLKLHAHPNPEHAADLSQRDILF